MVPSYGKQREILQKAWMMGVCEQNACAYAALEKALAEIERLRAVKKEPLAPPPLPPGFNLGTQ